MAYSGHDTFKMDLNSVASAPCPKALVIVKNFKEVGENPL